jgi:hypothetical protein
MAKFTVNVVIDEYATKSYTVALPVYPETGGRLRMMMACADMRNSFTLALLS